MVNVWTGLYKTNVDDLDVDKLKTVSEHLNKLSDLVKNKVAKKQNLIHSIQK